MTSQVPLSGLQQRVTVVEVGTNPPGTIIYVARSTVPTGYIKANGSTISRSTYSALFSAIGTTFGAGDGTTTFTIPDLRGEFIRGFDDGRGIDSGRALGNTQLDAMQNHGHNMTNAGIWSFNGGNTGGWGIGGGYFVGPNNQAFAGALRDIGNGEPRTTSETRPRNVSMLACIKT